MCREFLTISLKTSVHRIVESIIGADSSPFNIQCIEDVFQTGEDGKGMSPDVINMRGGLLHTLQFGQLRQNVREGAQHFQRTHRCLRLGTFEYLEEFITLAFRGNARKLARKVLHLSARGWFNMKVKSSSHANPPQNAHRV